MSTSYFIFKTDNISGKTIHICNGSHDTEHECNIHWQSYMYGFYDGCVEALGSGKFQFMNGSRKNSFHFSYDGKISVDYFMLLDQAGHDLIMEISKAETNQ